MVHLPAGHRRGGGRSAGLPRGAPASTQLPISAISSAVSDGSSLNAWIPMFLSMNQGGISRASVRWRMERAQGRTSW